MSAAGEGRTLRIGIAGLGQAGSALVPAVHRNPRLAITAVADPNAAGVAAFVKRYRSEGYRSIEAMCESDAVDLVYVATPTHLHAAHVMTTLAHGKHVIVEKPMALTLAEADAMITEAGTRGRQLVVGHSQSFEPPVRAMRGLVRAGALGPLRMMNTWYYTDWLYRPRAAAELDTALGGGVVFRQGAHQADMLRWIGGGMVRSVRAATGAWDPERPTEGSLAMFLDFEAGTIATAVFSGYDHFHSREMTGGIGEDGRARSAAAGGARTALRAAAAGEGELELKRSLGFGTAVPPAAEHASFYGVTVVSCERGDVRQSPGGLHVYGDEAEWEIAVPPIPNGRDVLLEEAYAAVVQERAPAHGGAWAKANLEACLAVLESARTRREVRLQHQVPTPD
ncbi:MAG: Gfo/Idh/MocA family oxidoreductase [Chloroflexi bacterium]|nr:Gfo/Idh/MocA family oxidoreductase [Chloroflexota bacterium]